MASKDANNIVWIDMEMTGLDSRTEHILEIACIITDGDLAVVKEGPDLVIHQPASILEKMGPWCQKHHRESGLLAEVEASKLSVEEAEDRILKFVQQYTPPKQCPLGGNSVHADRAFLQRYMPKLEGHLHYRIIDVSTVKELCKRWYPRQSQKIKKAYQHRALADIMESINELKFYRRSIFR